MKRYISSIFLLFFIACSIRAQVTIAPTNLFITDDSKFGSYLIINSSNQTQEISVDFFFAYSGSLPDGTRQLITTDSTSELQYSIADKIRAFPRNFTVAPGQRQTVRLRINADNSLDDGTYWARIRTSSTPESPPVELQATDVVSARVAITIEQVTGLFYKVGDVSTGIEIGDITVEPNEEESSISVITSYERGGNSPFLGSISTSIVNNNGIEVRRAFVSTSLYFDGAHRQEFDIDDLPAGNYIITSTFESSRSDVPTDDIIPIETQTRSISYTIR